MENRTYYVHMKDAIIACSKELASKITALHVEREKELSHSSNELDTLRVELVELYGACLGLTEEQRKEVLQEWGEKFGAQSAKQENVTIDMVLREVPLYREVIGELILTESDKLQLTSHELYDVITKFDRCIHDIVFYFSVPFVRHEKQKLELSRQLVTELSVPVVLITDKIAVLPLVGSINDERAKILHERALQEAARLQIEFMFVDLSGVQTIDTYVAQQLFHLLDSLALLGVEGKVSGISPIIAQTLVQLGLDFGRFDSYSSLKQALLELK